MEVRGGATTTWTIEPAALGYLDLEADDLAGGDPAENARIVLAVLAGRGQPAAEAAVVLNAAAALYVGGLATTYADAVAGARRALAAGAGLEALERMRRAYREAAARRTGSG
jgi:anthranilate phosphoribosyltransferase